MHDNEFLKSKTGNLSAGEIELILDSLPVDMTFIGKNDEVRYFKGKGLSEKQIALRDKIAGERRK